MPQELRKTSKKPPTPLGRNFHRFWIGSLSSNLADGVMLVALPMVAAMLTNDPLLGGLLGRIELYHVPLVAGTVVLLALLPTIPALRRMTRRADEVEREAVQERPSA